MQKLVALLLLAGLAGIDARAEEPTPPPANPRTYALVAAFPDRFSVVYEKGSREGAGSSIRVDQFRRSTLEAPAGTFNRVALAGLEKVIARRDPGARFVALALPGATPDDVAGVDREDFLLRRVTGELKALQQRAGWHRIVVVLPTYRVLEFDGMPTRVEGFGLFMQPNCQSNPYSCSMAFRPPSGPDTLGPDGQPVRANFFVAPFSYVAIVILDPATLAVLDRERKLDFQRLFDPQSGTLDLGQNIPKDVLAGQVVQLIERSLGSAIAKTELAGKAEIGEVREVKPGR